MIKVLIFDLGHTILDEEAGRDVDIHFRPAIPMPGVQELIPQIRLPMGIWANTRDTTAKDVKQWLSRADLDQYFRWIITSSDVGYRKPDERFFASALRECGYSANEVLFIGNQLNSDIKGANICSIQSVLLTGPAYRSNDDIFDPTAFPTYKIEHLGELLLLLAKIGLQDSAE
jgi:FMN phosphatase YigB (HAD superfamily)